MSKIWEDFLVIAKEEVGSRVVETWFRAVSLQQWDPVQKVAYLHAPNAFVREWLKNNYLPIFQVHLGRLLNAESPKIIFVTGQEEPADLKTHTGSELVTVQPALPVSTARMAETKVSLREQSHINKNYVFENFVVGSHNSLAYAAAYAVSEQPGKVYNPLFIYGCSGLGKTHLLHAIGNAIRERDKKSFVLYQTTDRFVNEFINAIRFDKVHKFEAKYRNIDVLLIDDVQFISNKEQTQEAFFHIFNSLHDSHKQIVFSSDTFPQDLAGLAERLRSRLAWGLVTDIQPPSIETKIAILKKKADASKELLSDEVAEFIASRVISNIRELEGSLIRVIAFASLTKQPITLELAKKVLVRTEEEVAPGQIDLEKVVRCVNKYYSYSLGDLRSKNRNKDLSFARQVTMFLMKKVTDKSLRDIGFYLGGKDHSTVMHALKKVQYQADSDHSFAAKLKKMEKEILP
jgi:chromosomal replication initiator protein